MSMERLPMWARFAALHKARWMNSGDQQIAPPSVVAERLGKPQALVIVTSDDDDDLFRVIAMLTKGLDADAIVAYHDTHYAMRNEEMGKELAARMRDNPGFLQRMADEGGLERGTVVEAMFAYRRTIEGVGEGCMLPYRIVGGQPHWMDDECLPMGQPTGSKPDLVGEAMAHALTIDLDGALSALASFLGLTPEQAAFRRARASLQAIQDLGFMVMPLQERLGEVEDFAIPRPMSEAERRKRRAKPDAARAWVRRHAR